MKNNFINKDFNFKKLSFLGLGTLLLAFLVFFAPLRSLNNLYYDAGFRFRSAKPPSEVIIVGIDGRSVNEYGGWPWPRGTIARLMDAINRAGPGAVAVDVLFPRRFDAPAADDSLKETLGRAARLVLPLHAAAFGKEPEHAASALRADILKHRFLMLRNQDRLNRINFFSAGGLTGCDTQFTGSAVRCGFINVSTSASTQRLREAVQVIRVGSDYFPSFGLAAAAAFLGIGPDSLVLDGKGKVLVGGRVVPLTAYAATTPVNYRGRPGTITTVPAVDVIKGRAAPSLLHGRLVFVGVTEPGVAADFFITPVGSQFPGVELWATIAADILSGAWIKLPSGLSGLLNWLILFLIFPGIALLFPAKRRAAALLCGTGVTLVSVIAGVAAFQKLNLYWDAVNHVYGWLFSVVWIAVQKAAPSLVGLPSPDLDIPQEDTRDLLPPPHENEFLNEVPVCSTAEFACKGAVTKDGRHVPVPVPDDFSSMAGGRIVRLLGSGGMADVYLIWKERLELYRAVKVLKPGQQRSFLERFETEIRIFSKLNHPAIVHCYGAGEWRSLPCVEMEYVHGASLQSVLTARGPLAAEQALAVGILVCKALDYAHKQVFTLYGRTYSGVVHRDLKPANILVSMSGRVKLTDFGIARPCEASLHTLDSGTIVGTLPYLAPEQIDGANIGPAADIYALGATLYELLTGQRAFPGTEMTAIMKAKIMGDFEPLRPSAAVPAPVVDAVIRAMAANPAERFESAADFGTSLENCLQEMLKDHKGKAYVCLQELAADYWGP
jgi:CHASE2 domain-containing sensor protein/tRNA A-37 threonylcarbamoyl transferase component Bud32